MKSNSNSAIKYVEMMKKENRSYVNFLRGCKTTYTRKSYVFNMKRFIEFLFTNGLVSHPDKYDELLKLDSEKITDYLIAWIEHIEDTGVSPRSIPVMLAGPELFFMMNRKVWHDKIVRRGIRKDDTEPSGREPVTSDELVLMLASTKKLRTKAFVHFMASTGIRPGAIEDPILRIKHLVDMPDPTNPTLNPRWCYAVRIYDDSVEGYWAFLTPEARMAVDTYISSRKLNGEDVGPESPLFATVSKSKIGHLSGHSGRTMIYKLIKMSGIKRKKSNFRNNRYDKAVMYMFRKRFNTILKLNNSVNSNIAEKLMAHKRGLDGVYLRPTREECYREFVKAIHDLTIYPSDRQKLEIEEKQKKIDILESRREDAEDMSKVMDIMLKRIEFLEKARHVNDDEITDEDRKILNMYKKRTKRES